MTPEVIARADELIAAHNEAIADRSKTMMNQSETERQAEQVLSQLTSWVRQQAKANASSQQVIADYKAVMDAQRAEIETLRARLTAAVAENDDLVSDLQDTYDSYVDDHDEAVDDNAALVEALEMYGEHHGDCDWKRTDCTCGLYAIRSTADHPGAALLSELDNVRKERDAAVADNAALLNEMRRACQKGSATPVTSAELLQLALANEHPGKALLDAADHLATDSDRWRSLAMDMHDCLQDKTAWARAWKAAAKRIKEDRDEGSWYGDAIRLKIQLGDAQQRIAELEAAACPVITERAVATWKAINGRLYSLDIGSKHATIALQSNAKWDYSIGWHHDTCHVTSFISGAVYATAEEAMRAAEAALGVEVTQ